MKKLIIKGVDPNLLTTYVKKSALLAVKRDSIVSDILPLYFTKNRVVSVKEDGSSTTHKIWELPLDKFCENHEEVAQNLGDSFCRLAIFSCKQFVTKGLKYFTENVDLEILVEENADHYDAIGVMTLKNKKANFRFSVTDANHAFKSLNGGWEFVEEYFNTDKENKDVRTSFTISKEELKGVKELTKIVNVVDMKHEYVSLKSSNGMLVASSHSADLNLHESNIELSEIKIKNSTLLTLCDETYNVFLKVFRNIPFIVFKSTETNTRQSITLLTEFNSNTDLESVEDEIAQIDFTEWDSQDDDPLF